MRKNKLLELNLRKKEKLIKANLSLIPSIIEKNYFSKGLPLLDLIQAGNLGLIRVVEKFKDNKRADFKKVASRYIKRQIEMAIPELRGNKTEHSMPPEINEMPALWRRLFKKYYKQDKNNIKKNDRASIL